MLKISPIETNSTPKAFLFAFAPARTVRTAAALGAGLAAAAAALVGCTVGPTFHSPPAPDATDYTRTPMPAETASAAASGGSAQRFAPQWGCPPRGWPVFRCDELDKLIGAALADSPSLGQARGRLVQAQEDLNARRGALDYPQLDADLYARRQRINPAALGLTSVPHPGPFTLS